MVLHGRLQWHIPRQQPRHRPPVHVNDSDRATCEYFLGWCREHLVMLCDSDVDLGDNVNGILGSFGHRNDHRHRDGRFFDGYGFGGKRRFGWDLRRCRSWSSRRRCVAGVGLILAAIFFVWKRKRSSGAAAIGPDGSDQGAWAYGEQSAGKHTYPMPSEMSAQPSRVEMEGSHSQTVYPRMNLMDRHRMS